MRLRIIIIVLLLTMGPMLVAAQAAVNNRLMLRRMPADKGWPTGQVNSLLRDERGCLWMGTPEGLVCFDGTQCHTFCLEGRRSEGQDNSIHGLMMDRMGRLWMRAGRRYLYFDRERGDFARDVERIWGACGWTGRGPDVMTVDDGGRLWAMIDGKGLFALDDGGGMPVHWPLPEGLRGLVATDLTVVGERVWVAFGDGTVACRDLRRGMGWTVCRQMALELGGGLRDEVKLLADREGDLWAYCVQGVWHYDGWRQEMSCVVRTEEGDFVRVMAQDALHRIWVGRDRSGLSVLEKESGEEMRLVHDPADPHSLPGNGITALACCADSAVLIGTYQSGVALYHPHLFLFGQDAVGEVNALAEDGAGHLLLGRGGEVVMMGDDGRGNGNPGADAKVLEVPGSVVCMRFTRDSTLWVGSFRGGLTALRGGQRRTFRRVQGLPQVDVLPADGPGQGLACDNVWALEEDSCGALWIATLGGGLQRFQPRTGQWTTFSCAEGTLADDYLSSLAPSRRGGLWIGMASRGFAFIAFDDLRITCYNGTLRGDRRMHSPYVNQLYEDTKGWLWLATRNGVEVYLPDEDRLLSLPLPERCSSFAEAVAEDSEGALWIALGHELLRVVVDREKCCFVTRRYGEEEGLAAGVLCQRALCLLHDGRMAVGGTEGLYTFDPRLMGSHYSLQVFPEEGGGRGGVILLVAALLLGVLAAWLAWRTVRRLRRGRAAAGSTQHAGRGQQYLRIEPQYAELQVESLDEQLVARATCYVEANMARSELSVEELSQELAMSRGHLYKRLTQLTGMTPVEFIRTIRLHRAAQLLKRSGMTVAEVAYAVGFNNPKYFSRYFKEAYGMLPSAYRNSAKLTAGDENITSDNPSGDN